LNEAFENVSSLGLMTVLDRNSAAVKVPFMADDTFWTLEVIAAYFWVHATKSYPFHSIRDSSTGKCRETFWDRIARGLLVFYCIQGLLLAAHDDRNKKCLGSLARTACDWQKLTKDGTLDFCVSSIRREVVRAERVRFTGNSAARSAQEQLRKKIMGSRALKY